MMDRIHTALNQELIKRLMVRYFTQKGFKETFNRKIYPPTLQDLPVQIPQLAGKIEIQPYVEDIDPNTGVVKLGWNLFVLGVNRIFIGESTHTNLNEVRSGVAGPLQNARQGIATTPKKITEFIIKILGSSKNGDISSMPQTMT